MNMISSSRVSPWKLSVYSVTEGSSVHNRLTTMRADKSQQTLPMLLIGGTHESKSSKVCPLTLGAALGILATALGLAAMAMSIFALVATLSTSTTTMITTTSKSNRI